MLQTAANLMHPFCFNFFHAFTEVVPVFLMLGPLLEANPQLPIVYCIPKVQYSLMQTPCTRGCRHPQGTVLIDADLFYSPS